MKSSLDKITNIGNLRGYKPPIEIGNSLTQLEIHLMKFQIDNDKNFQAA